jgi:signal transduction histidine kinase
MMVAAIEHKLSADGHSFAGEARKVHALIDEAIHHTHDLAHNFSSLDVRGDDLASMLKGLAQNVKKMFTIPCAFGSKGILPELAQHTTLQLYKIAQESVSNAIKHGKATQVSIAVTRNSASLTLTISNDGIPFCPPSQPTKRMGLRIMNYRANTIGASLQIEPNDNSGTIVTCEIPIKNGVKPFDAGPIQSFVWFESPNSLTRKLQRAPGTNLPLPFVIPISFVIRHSSFVHHGFRCCCRV